MVDIRPNQLPPIEPLEPNDIVIVDQGTDGVRQGTSKQVVDFVSPVATQAKAVAGVDDNDRMTALKTKQSIASEVGVTISSAAQGSLADTAVQSVNGKTGNSVTLVKSDIALGNVDNTSDASKPISTATQTALDLKANSSVTISAGTGLTGGGNLTNNRSVALNATSIASLEKADTSVQTVNGVPPTGGNVNVTAQDIRDIDTASLVASTVFPSSDNFLRTAGYSTVGDGGAALYKRVASEPSHIGKVQSLDGAWWEITDLLLRPEMFGIKGDGSDETTLIQGINNFASGKEISWPLGKTYGYTAFEIPNDVKWSGVGFTLRRLVASVSPGIRINNWFRAESLVISTPGGTGSDKAIRWQGSNNHIKYLDIRADAEGNDSSTNWAIEMESNPTGSTLSRNNIEAAYCLNFSTFLFGTNISLLNCQNLVIEKYRTAVYFRDIVRSRLVNVIARGLGNAVNGRPGENGLLLEARTNNATSDLVIENWIVEDSGEHAYRLGGQRTIRNVWFNQCVSRRSGSSILTGNLSSGEWHGGCGFKVLGGGEVGGTRHKNIFFNQCEVFDVNQTFGTYPSGHGVNNFSPFLIVLADNVHLNSCLADAESLSTSCRQGLLVGHCNGVFVNDCILLKCSDIAIKPYQETPFPGFPGYLTSLENFHVRGGLFEVTNTTANSGVVYYFSDAATIINRRLTVKGAEFRGGASALRIETVGSGGGFNNCTAEFTYNGPTSVTESTTTVPLAGGGSGQTFYINAIANSRPNATNVARVGSMITENDTGAVKILKGAVWTTI